MKYKKEIDEMLNCLKEDWMSDKDFEEMKKEIFKLYPYEKMEKDIEEGVKNGYSPEKQLELMKVMLTVN